MCDHGQRTGRKLTIIFWYLIILYLFCITFDANFFYIINTGFIKFFTQCSARQLFNETSLPEWSLGISYLLIFYQLQQNWTTSPFLMKMMMMNYLCGMANREKAFSLISCRDCCQRSSPSRICAEREFRLCWMKLCSSDNHYTTVPQSTV